MRQRGDEGRSCHHVSRGHDFGLRGTAKEVDEVDDKADNTSDAANRSHGDGGTDHGGGLGKAKDKARGRAGLGSPRQLHAANKE